LTANDDITCRINSVDLKNRLSDIETDGRDRLHVWLLRIVGALTAPTSMALPCRWRSRPQHQKRTPAPQQKISLFDHLVGAGDDRSRYGYAQQLRGCEVDDKFKLRRFARSAIHPVSRREESCRCTRLRAGTCPKSLDHKISSLRL